MSIPITTTNMRCYCIDKLWSGIRNRFMIDTPAFIQNGLLDRNFSIYTLHAFIDFKKISYISPQSFAIFVSERRR